MQGALFVSARYKDYSASINTSTGGERVTLTAIGGEKLTVMVRSRDNTHLFVCVPETGKGDSTTFLIPVGDKDGTYTVRGRSVAEEWVNYPMARFEKNSPKGGFFLGVVRR